MSNVKDNDILDELICGKMPNFSRPVIFLDFDGVVNLGGEYKKPESENREFVHINCVFEPGDNGDGTDFRNIPISFYAEVVDTLRDMNCIWCTSWKKFTQSKINPALNFDFGYVDWKYRGFSDDGTYGKINAISKIVRETGCDWIVVDDAFFDFEKILEEDCGKEGIVIIPDSWNGLSEDEMKFLSSTVGLL